MKHGQLNSLQVFARGCTIAIRLMVITRLLSVLSIGIGVVPGRETVTEIARHGMYHATPIFWTYARSAIVRRTFRLLRQAFMSVQRGGRFSVHASTRRIGMVQSCGEAMR